MRAEDEGASPRETFRLQAAFRYAVLGAVYLWVLVLFALVGLRDAPDRLFLYAVFVVALFTATGVFYNNQTIEVDDEGVTYRGLVRARTLPFSDIFHVDVRPGLLGFQYAGLRALT